MFGATWPLAAVALVPVAVARAVGGLGSGPLAGLRAFAATSASFGARSIAAGIGMVLVLVGGAEHGPTGAAWGMAIGSAVSAVLLWRQFLRQAHGANNPNRAAGQRPVRDVLWLTNIPVPYRLPVWRELTTESRLLVAFQANTEPNRDWSLASELEAIPHTFVHGRRVGGAATPLYLPGLKTRRVLRRRTWDLIVIDGWESPAYWQAMAHARIRGIPVVTLYRSTLQTRRFDAGPAAWIRRVVLRSSCAVITAGAASTDAVLADGVPESRITAVFNPVDVNRITQIADAARRAEDKTRVNSSGRGHQFVVIGQLIERKNVASAIRAFAQMCEPSDRLTIIGSGPLEDHLRRVAIDTLVADRIDFLGSLEPDHTVVRCAASHTLVLGSTEEVWGLVVNEALAAGIHVVVSDRAGVSSAVTGMPGVFIAIPDIDGLATAMAASRAAWTGPISRPEVLTHRPEHLVEVVLAATQRSA